MGRTHSDCGRGLDQRGPCPTDLIGPPSAPSPKVVVNFTLNTTTAQVLEADRVSALNALFDKRGWSMACVRIAGEGDGVRVTGGTKRRRDAALEAIGGESEDEVMGDKEESDAIGGELEDEIMGGEEKGDSDEEGKEGQEAGENRDSSSNHSEENEEGDEEVEEAEGELSSGVDDLQEDEDGPAKISDDDEEEEDSDKEREEGEEEEQEEGEEEEEEQGGGGR